MAVDRFASASAGLGGPHSRAVAVAPSNTVDLVNATRGVYIGVAGDLTADLVGGSTNVLFKALAVGIVHPLRVSRIYATGTTATSILALD
jgi:hypothetical protein